MLYDANQVLTNETIMVRGRFTTRLRVTLILIGHNFVYVAIPV